MNQPDMAEALAAALARLEAGDSPEAILSEQPAVAADLAPLLAAASALGMLPTATPRPAYRAAGAQDLARIEASLAAERVAGPGRAGMPVWRLIAAVVVLGGIGLWLSHTTGRPARQPTDQLAAALRPSPTAAPDPAAPATRVARTRSPRVVAIARPVVALPPAGAAAAAAPARVARGSTLPSGRGTGPRLSVTVTAIAAQPGSTPHATAATASDTDAPPDPPTAQPTASVTPTATQAVTAAPHPSVTLGGMVRLGTMPLDRIRVGLFIVPDGADCPRADTPVATATTDAGGAFTLEGPSDVSLALAAWGGPHCLPPRWHTGENSIAAADACDEGVQRFVLGAGASAGTLNVLFAEDTPAICPHAPTPAAPGLGHPVLFGGGGRGRW